MELEKSFHSAALKAASVMALVKVMAHIPTKGHSSLTYLKLFNRVIALLGRHLLYLEIAHLLMLEVIFLRLVP